jgi:UDP-glucose:(heptosyl)LPS alpha-1,3-glucosyltransferase
MRISYIVPRCCPDNSHGRYVIELAKRFRGQHAITVYSGTFEGDWGTDVRCRTLLVPNRPAVVRLASLWAASLTGLSLGAEDIVHVQGADAPVANVVTAQCCAAAMNASGARGRSLHRRLNFALGAAGEKYCMSKRSTRRVIAVSTRVKNEIEHLYGVDPTKTIVVPLGVDPDEFNPRQAVKWRDSVRASLGIDSSEFVVIFVGGDFRRKGLMELVKAASSLRSFRVLAVGVRPDAGLTQALDKRGLRGRFTFVDVTSNVAPLYAAADCFALLTRYDTFSMATVEAMATGLPVLVSREAGVTEHLKDGFDSFLLSNCTDVDNLTRLIDTLVRIPELRLTIGTAARKTAELFSWDRIAMQTLAVYEQVA